MKSVTSPNYVTYAVTVEALLDATQQYDIDELADLLTDFSGAVAGDREGVSATLDIRASSPAQAADEAQRTVHEYLEKVGARVVGFTGLSAITAEEQERTLATPIVPPLLGVTEVSRELGVSKQRVAQLRDRPDFPDPVAELAAGPVWTQASLSRFIEQWDRSPGRPKKVSTAQAGTALLVLGLIGLAFCLAQHSAGSGGAAGQVLSFPGTAAGGLAA